MTISDTRTEETDESGKMLKDILLKGGHSIVAYSVVPDDIEAIRGAVESLLSSGADVIFTNGGTGISRRDVTPEAVSPLIDKKLPGFGEIFRHLSFREVGAAAALSRAFAGVSRGKLVVCLPGSKNAVRLGAELLVSELGHFVWEVRK